VTPDVARAIAQLCRAGRYAALDRAELIAAFVRGLLARGPVEPGDLLQLLEAADIPENAWRVAADVCRPPTPFLTQRRQKIRNQFLRRFGGLD
jgi:hypothetical protein